MKHLKFSDIEKTIQATNINKIKKSPLELWYDSIRNNNIEELKIEDLCKCMRQNIFLEYTIPIVIKHVKENINSGDMYDGEMLISLKYVPEEFWHNNFKLKNELIEMIKNNYNGIENYVIKDAQELLESLLSSGEQESSGRQKSM